MKKEKECKLILGHFDVCMDAMSIKHESVSVHISIRAWGTLIQITDCCFITLGMILHEHITVRLFFHPRAKINIFYFIKVLLIIHSTFNFKFKTF